MHCTTRSLRGCLGAGIGGLASLLALLAASPSAHAITYLTVDNHPAPVTLLTGEHVVVRFDVAKPGGNVWFVLALDLGGAGTFDPGYPTTTYIGPATDNDGLDADPTPGKIAYPVAVYSAIPAGRYVVSVADASDGSSLAAPWRIAPKPEAQAISGRVAVVSDANPAGALPQDAVIWAYRDFQTPVASASIQPDGSYTLPVPPGTYIVFAEWFGNLRSQRQSVNLVAGQQQADLDLSLLPGQEVSGRVMDGSTPVADSIVQASAGDGKQLTTRSFADGSYVFILPNGPYRLSARGLTEAVTAADAPVDGVDFPLPLPAPDLAAGMIRTVAGNGLPGFGGDGRRATAARFLTLGGIEVDAAGNLYIADFDAHRVRKVDAKTGLITTLAGSGAFDTIRGLSPRGSPAGFSGDGGPATAAKLFAPGSVAVDAAGTLYIADALNHRVRKVDPTGIITTVAGSGPAPGEGGFSGDGGPATAARLNFPVGVALDRAGNLYISDLNNARVRKVNREGIITTAVGGGTKPFQEGGQATAIALNVPLGVAVDAAGNLFIGDQGLSRVLKVSPAGIITTVAGSGTGGFSGEGGPATAAQINIPVNVVVDSAGDLYFTDAANHRVHKVSADGILTTVAGSGAAGGFGVGDFSGDGGPATAARLNGPFGVAIDKAGNLYVADQGNARIRKVVGIAAPGLF